MSRNATLTNLIAELEACGIYAYAEGDRLRISAPVGTLTQGHRSTLAAHKSALLGLLRKRTSSLRRTSTGKPTTVCHACRREERWEDILGISKCRICHPPAPGAEKVTETSGTEPNRTAKQ